MFCCIFQKFQTKSSLSDYIKNLCAKKGVFWREWFRSFVNCINSTSNSKKHVLLLKDNYWTLNLSYWPTFHSWLNQHRWVEVIFQWGSEFMADFFIFIFFSSFFSPAWLVNYWVKRESWQIAFDLTIWLLIICLFEHKKILLACRNQLLFACRPWRTSQWYVCEEDHYVLFFMKTYLKFCHSSNIFYKIKYNTGTFTWFIAIKIMHSCHLSLHTWSN